MTSSLLEVLDVSKAFGKTHALTNVRLEARAGEVHAVLGENGAGKSTLMKILAGALRPDAGRMTLAEAPFAPAGPVQARQAGVAIVYQEPQLCPHLTVAENLMLGAEPLRWGLLDRSAMRKHAAAAIAEVAGEEHRERLHPDVLVATLSPGDRQLVAIARALGQSKCRVLILDEPTSSLTAADVKRLFVVIARLRERGLCVIYISHFLEEVKQIADRFTVLRDGCSVGSGSVAEVAVSDIVTLMVGREVKELYPRSERQRCESMLKLEQLAPVATAGASSLELYGGEVVGIAGLVGAGRTELLRSIFGLDAVRSGRVRVKQLWGAASPARRLRQGVGLLSEDRKGEGLAANMSIADNLTLSKLTGLGSAGLIFPQRQRAVAQRWADELQLVRRDVKQPVRELSGGNQQKVALARMLYHDVDVLLLDEPTRGIDVASRAQIYALIDELAARGKAVLMVSSYLPELFGVCDRIAVMQKGVLGEARPVSALDEHAVLMEATGA